MDYYFIFEQWKERARQRINVEAISNRDDDYIGFLEIKDIDIVDEFMREWVQIHPLPRVKGDGFLDQFGKTNLVSPLRKRFVTNKEFSEVFNSSLGLKLANHIESVKRNLHSKKLSEEQRAYEQKKRENQASRAELEGERGAIKAIGGMIISGKEALESPNTNITIHDNELSKYYHQFYNLHPVYGLLNIKGEEDRQSYALIFEEKDSYFHAMNAVNKTLGSFFFAYRRFRIPDKARKMHTYIVAGSGSGKSELFKSLIYLDWLKGKSSVIVIDPNGDLSKQVGRFKENKQRAEDILYIDPIAFRNDEEPKIPIVNLFDVDGLNILEDDLDQLVSTIFEAFKSVAQEAGEGMTSYTPNMQNIMTNGIRLMCYKEGADLWDLQRLMDDERNGDLLQLASNSKNAVMRGFFETTFHNTAYKTAKQGIITRIDFIKSKGVAKYLCGKTSIDIEKAMNGKKLIIFNLAKGVIGKDKSLIYGKFMLAYILGLGLKRASIEEKYRVPCNIYIDEFHNYATDKLQELFEEGRKYKIYLTVATQTKGQRLTRQMNDSVFGNTYVKITGSASRSTRSAMAKEMELTNKEISEITGISEKSLKELKIGEFIVQVGHSGTPFKMTNRKKLLGDRHSMSQKDWDSVLSRQKSLYYVEEKEITDEKIHGGGKGAEERRNNAQGNKFGNNAKDLDSKFDL